MLYRFPYISLFCLVGKLCPFLTSTFLRAFFHSDFFFNCHLENYLSVPWLETWLEFDLFSLDLVSIPGPISCGQGWALVTEANVHSVGLRCRPFEKETLQGKLPNLSNVLSIPVPLLFHSLISAPTLGLTSLALIYSNPKQASHLQTGISLQFKECSALIPSPL